MYTQYHMRYMRMSDVQRVAYLDRVSFSTPWSAETYAREVSEALYSHMLVIESVQKPPVAAGWQGLWQRVSGAATPTRTIVSYGGLWIFDEEAHISTIASHPEHRAQGWGELALVAMLRRSIALGAGFAALEVRVSNTPAQTLYQKYGFSQFGIKPRYYYDNFEDAYDMRADLRNAALHTQIESRYAAFMAQRATMTDTYTHGTRPRLR